MKRVAEPSRYLRYLRRLSAVLDTILLVIGVGGLIGSVIAAFEGQWAEAIGGGILSFVWVLLWWLWRQAP